MTQASIPHESAIARCVARQPAVRLAIVFGSLAAGRSTAQSDLDLAVAGARPLSAEEQAELRASLAEATGRPVDLIDLTTAPPPLLGRVLATGRVLTNRDPVLYAALIKRAIYDDADLEPYRQRILAVQRRRWTAA